MKTFLVNKETKLTKEQLNLKSENVAIVLGAHQSDYQSVYSNLKSVDPSIKIVGLGTSKTFFNSNTLNVSDYALGMLSFDKTKTQVFVQENTSWEASENSGSYLVEKLVSKSTPEYPLSGVLLFSEGLNINGAALVRPFEQLGIPVCGGLSAEKDIKFEKTFVFYEDKELNNNIIAVGFYGNHFEMQSFNSSGMKDIGVKKKITKAEKNILYTVDGQRAFDWYSMYLKEEMKDSSNLLSYPIAIFNGDDIDGAIRTPIGYDEKEGTVIFTGEIVQGQELKLMMANPYELIHHTGEIVSKDDVFIHFSCSARQLLLKDLVSLEYAKAKNCIGGYVYGEIATLNGRPQLLNQTFTSIKISEK